MRLKIGLKCNRLILPKNYQHALQGLIYAILRRSAYSDSFHDQGYGTERHLFKLFVFSNLRGKFQLQEDRILFEDKACFYIASADPSLIQILYDDLARYQELELVHQKVRVESITIENLSYFPGIKKFDIELFSPVTAYRSKDRRFSYYKPGDPEFEDLCRENLEHKNQALEVPCQQPFFEIVDVSRIQKKLVHFKNTFYIAYTGRISIHANYPAMYLIWNTGLSAKGSSGFGCVEIVHESDLPV